jgi:opacity protein-like surface antigen
MRKTLVRSIITLCAGLATATMVKAQDPKPNRLFRMPAYVDPPSWSIGINVGMSDLWGDVGTKSIIDHYVNEQYWSNTKFMGGLYGRYMPHPALGIRLGVNYGMLYASDKLNEDKAKKASSIEDDSYQRYLRNLNVKTRIWETQLLFEINLRRFNVESDAARKHFNPYIAVGVGGYNFKAKGEFLNEATGVRRWIDLDKLNLEGQGTPNGPAKYSQWQVNVPLGLGLRWDIGRQLGLGVEYMYRYCFTDYLDNVSANYVDPNLFGNGIPTTDVSASRAMFDKSWEIDKNITHQPGEKRGNSAVKDSYSTISINFYYKIKSRKSPWWY